MARNSKWSEDMQRGRGSGWSGLLLLSGGLGCGCHGGYGSSDETGDFLVVLLVLVPYFDPYPLHPRESDPL